MTRDPVTRFLLDELGCSGTSAAGPSPARAAAPRQRERGTAAGRGVSA